MKSSSQLGEFEKRLHSLKAKDMMTRSVMSVKKDMHLASLSDIFLTKRISGVPVVDETNKIIGIITATDLFSLMYMLKSGQIKEDGKQGVCNPTVDFAMSHDVISVKEETSLEDIMAIMRERNIHSLPVMDGQKLLGIIGRRDVLRHFYSIVKEIFGA